ncbi:MAG: MarR family transcriptional regulator, partial [Hyphomicrobiales bacterium]
RDMGLTLSRARLLMQLAKADGPIQSDLAGLLDIEQPTLVRLLDGLERTGMIERRASPGDRRARRVFLTPVARAQAEDILAFLTDLRADVLDGVDKEELEIALRVLSRMSQNIVANRGTSG